MISYIFPVSGYGIFVNIICPYDIVACLDKTQIKSPSTTKQ